VCVASANILILIRALAATLMPGTDSAGQATVDREIWHTESDGSVSTEIPSLKIIVRKAEGCARYVIPQNAGYGSCDEVMLASGTEPNEDAAILAAQRAAKRIDVMLTARRRSAIHADAHRSVRADVHLER
jgi:hypothetical protein